MSAFRAIPSSQGFAGAVNLFESRNILASAQNNLDLKEADVLRLSASGLGSHLRHRSQTIMGDEPLTVERGQRIASAASASATFRCAWPSMAKF